MKRLKQHTEASENLISDSIDLIRLDQEITLAKMNLLRLEDQRDSIFRDMRKSVEVIQKK